LRGGLFGPSTGRHTAPGRHRPDPDKVSRRQQKKTAAATEKAAKKALKRAAKDLTAKTRANANGGKSGKTQTLKAAAGRMARAALNATRPHAAAAGQTAAREAKHARGALWDGVCALTAGTWALMTRGRHGAFDRLKNVWKRRRKTRAKTNQPPATPPVADTVRRPANQTPTSPSTGGPAMSGGGHHFVAPAMELARAAAHYQPTGMLQVGADFAGLEEGLRLHAEAMKITVENADASQPLHPNIVELMRQIHGLQLKAAELASELTPAFRQLHDVDIARLENPRKGVAGERMWDVSSNL
jgi:hypothetical protein